MILILKDEKLKLYYLGLVEKVDVRIRLKVLLSLIVQQLLDFVLHTSVSCSTPVLHWKQFCPNPVKAENVLEYFTDLLGAAYC